MPQPSHARLRTKNASSSRWHICRIYAAAQSYGILDLELRMLLLLDGIYAAAPSYGMLDIELRMLPLLECFATSRRMLPLLCHSPVQALCYGIVEEAFLVLSLVYAIECFLYYAVS